MKGQAYYYDGVTARRHPVRLALSNDRLSLVIEGETLPQRLFWRLPELRALSDDNASRDRMTLTRHVESDDESPRDVARLVIADPDLIDVIRRTRPNLERADVHKGTGKRILKAAAFSIGAVCLLLFVILPAMANTLARIIPLEREIAFGKIVTAQMERVLGGRTLGALHCNNEDGLAALHAMEARLTEGRGLDYDINLVVFDHEMLNAFAAPGGQVVILRGLLDNAGSADEVAGVLAHEIGHVVNRDATRHALRATGSAGLLSMVLGDFTGGSLVVSMGEQLLSSAYTRDAERKADDFGLELLSDADVSSAGLAAFFDTLDAEMGEAFLPEYLNTHPVTKERAALARDNAKNQKNTSPVLTDAQWTALQNICD